MDFITTNSDPVASEIRMDYEYNPFNYEHTFVSMKQKNIKWWT